MRQLFTFCETGKKVHSNQMKGITLAMAATEFEECRKIKDEVEWFFVSDRDGDPILVSHQDWSTLPTWEVLHNED